MSTAIMVAAPIAYQPHSPGLGHTGKSGRKSTLGGGGEAKGRGRFTALFRNIATLKLPPEAAVTVGAVKPVAINMPVCRGQTAVQRQGPAAGPVRGAGDGDP